MHWCECHGDWCYTDLTVNTSWKNINPPTSSIVSSLGEDYQSLVHLRAVSIAWLAGIDNGVYKTLATIRYPQENEQMWNNFILHIWKP